MIEKKFPDIRLEEAILKSFETLNLDHHLTLCFGEDLSTRMKEDYWNFKCEIKDSPVYLSLNISYPDTHHLNLYVRDHNNNYFLFSHYLESIGDNRVHNLKKQFVYDKTPYIRLQYAYEFLKIISQYFQESAFLRILKGESWPDVQWDWQ